MAKEKFDGCELCGHGQHENVSWQATTTGWAHDNCTEMDNVVGSCNICNGVVRLYMLPDINELGQHNDCVERQRQQQLRELQLMEELKPEMVAGFEHITVHTIYALLEEVASEGTCWLAYDNPQAFIQKTIFKLQPELKELRERAGFREDSTEEDDKLWLAIDYEIIELSIALSTMRLACTNKLFWCSACRKISSDKFTCEHGSMHYYSIDFSSMDEDFYF